MAQIKGLRRHLNPLSYNRISINFYLPLSSLMIKLITKSAIKIKKRILAIPAAPAAIPPKPKTAAIKAIIRKVIIQRNIILFGLIQKLKHEQTTIVWGLL